MFSVFPLVLAAAALPLVNAQSANSTFLTGLISALQAANLTSLAMVATMINSTTSGQELLAGLATGNYTIFAPTDVAFSALPSNITSDPTVLADTIAYHIVSGNFSGYNQTYPNVTLGRTQLNDSSMVKLEGNKSQVLAWTLREDNKTHILNQATDVVVTNTTSYQNINLYVIEKVLAYPKDLMTTVANNTNLTSLVSTVQSIMVSDFNSTTNTTSNVTLVEALSGAKGFTLFAPNNAAFMAAASTLSGLTSNMTAIIDVLRNHIINGTTVYSSGLGTTGATTAAGEKLTFMSNTTGSFVTSGNVTAMITQPDVLLENGVIHVVDMVLANEQVDESAASSAYMSATSAAGVPTTETGPVGVTATGAGGSIGGGSSGGAFTNSIDITVALLSVVAGSLFVFA